MTRRLSIATHAALGRMMSGLVLLLLVAMRETRHPRQRAALRRFRHELDEFRSEMDGELFRDTRNDELPVDVVARVYFGTGNPLPADQVQALARGGHDLCTPGHSADAEARCTLGLTTEQTLEWVSQDIVRVIETLNTAPHQHTRTGPIGRDFHDG